LAIDEETDNEAIAIWGVWSGKNPHNGHHPVQYQCSSWCHELFIIAGEEIVEGNYALAGDLLLDYTELACSSHFGFDLKPLDDVYTTAIRFPNAESAMQTLIPSTPCLPNAFGAKLLTTPRS
jgi:hypothetical protein